MENRKIPITRIFTGDEELAEIKEAVFSGWVAQGPKVLEFERRFAATVDAKHAVAVSSCTAGLFLSLHLAGVGPGDEVIVPSFSFIATANSVVHCGAVPVFADIDPRTYTIDPNALEPLLSSRTKAIMPVHQVGQAADLDAIYAFATRHGLRVVEDAACAIGSTYKGRPIGSNDGIAVFSFHPRKMITTGEGGMITTSCAESANRLRILRHQGMDISDLERHSSDRVLFEQYPVVGYNFRMTDLQAALGLAQLGRLPFFLEQRKKLALRYDQAFREHPRLETPFVPEYSGHSYQSYILRVMPDAPLDRDKLMQYLLDRGIATRRGIMCAHLEPCYAVAAKHAGLTNSEHATRETLIIPLFPGMSEFDQEYVIDSILELEGGAR